MAAGGLGSYHRPYPGGAQTKHRHHPHTMGDATCAWIGHNPSDGRMVVLPPTASKCPFDDARVLVDIDGEGGVKMEMKA